MDRPGGPKVLTLHHLPVPPLAPNEVLIELDSAGVGSWDADIRGGWYPSGKPKFPFVLGVDGAGIVVARGSRVRRFDVGDAVYSYSFDNPKGGFYAEYVAVVAKRVGHVPERLTLEQAGALAATGLTALQGIDDALELARGETVLIHGASGAVGTLAVQFAKRRGARVFASASGKDGVALVRRLGADAAADGRRENITEAVRRFAPDGVDAVLALAGGSVLTRCLDTLKRRGRLAYPNGIEPAPRKRRFIHTTSYDAVSGIREFERLNRAVDEANLEVPIAALHPLAGARAAHERLAAGHVLGRIALKTSR